VAVPTGNLPPERLVRCQVGTVVENWPGRLRGRVLRRPWPHVGHGQIDAREIDALPQWADHRDLVRPPRANRQRCGRSAVSTARN